MKYLGINLVYGETKNELTVGKTYIYQVAKDYLAYLELPVTSEEEKRKKFYESRRIAGKVAFIRLVEGERGWRLLCRRLGSQGEFIEDGQLKL